MDINEARQLAGESMQYIGARYVPKFHENSVDPDSVEWDANVPYEPITVVSYRGDSYTSKIPVPATVGNPADNPHYWARTGQFNAAIAALQEEMQAVKLRVTDLETQNGNETLETVAQTLSGAVNELKNGVDTNTGNITTNSENIVAINNKISNMNYVNVKDFGAVGDGTTDDGDAIREAIAYCNEHGKTLVFNKGTYLYDYTSSTRVTCNIDFNGSTIILDCGSTSAMQAFLVGVAEVEISITEAELSEFKVTDSRLFNKSFLLDTPISLGQRGGTGDEFFYKKFFITDSNGNFTNDRLEPTLVEGTYRCRNYKPITKGGFYLKNAIVTSKVGAVDEHPRFIHVIENNVTIENFAMEYEPIENDAYNLPFIAFTRCYNGIAKNIRGVNPYGPHDSGYILEFTECYNMKVIDFIGVDKSGVSWGSIGTNFCTAMHYYNCVTQRIDCHHMGNYTADNCVLQYANFAGGIGDIVFNNCEFNYTVAQTNTGRMFLFRPDLQYLKSGNIVFNNCNFHNRTASPVYFLCIILDRPTMAVMPADIGFKELNVIFEKCKFDSNVFVSYMDMWISGYANNVSLIAHETEFDCNTIHNGGGSTLKKKYFKMVDCTFKNNTNTYIAKNSFEYFEFISCKILNKLICNDTATSAKIALINCAISELDLRSDDTMRILDCVVLTDSAPVFYGVPAHKIMKNNIVSAETTTHQSDWNN